MSATYAEFLRGKTPRPAAVGRRVEPGEVHPRLHPWQAELVRWSVERGRAGLWTTTGTGKSAMQLSWAALSGNTALVVAPLAVCRQTVREGALLDLDVRYVRDGGQVTGPGVWITNYEMVDRFDPHELDAVVLDEGCFPAGTLVDTPTGPKPIETLRTGDEICNAAGVDVVTASEQVEVHYAVRVHVAGRAITCSGTHPFFTQRGWVAAQDLEPGDSILVTAQAVRMVRGGHLAQGETSPVLQPIMLGEVADDAARRPGEPRREGKAAEAAAGLRVVQSDVRGRPGVLPQTVLWAILLSELAHDATGDQGQGAQPGRRGQAGGQEAGVPRVRVAAGVGADRSDPTTQPDRPARCARQDLPDAAGRRSRTFRAWGKWAWLDRATASAAGCTWADLGGGVRFVAGPADSWLPDALQARRRAARDASRYRAGWQLPPRPATAAGREEGRQAGFARVDGLEVLEPGDPRLDGSRDARGQLRLYDLQCARHPSYSVAGLLVHNSILRDSTGATRNMLIEQFAPVPRRLSCTATPAPNDAEELTNQSAFLGVMSRVDMLAAYFIHDDAGWKVKSHARRPMYRWMAQWAVALRRPSDMGYPDGGFDLPGLDVVPELVAADVKADGQLFATDLGGVSGTARVRKTTMPARCARAAELVAAEPQEPWLLWAGLNAEADLLAELIPGAVNVHGSMSPEEKADLLLGFADGHIPYLISKPSICSRGLNFQVCARQAMVGMGFSFEDYFQCIRRSYRYGQTRRVRVHVILSELEQQIAHAVARKEREHDRMMDDLVRETWAARRLEAAA